MEDFNRCHHMHRYPLETDGTGCPSCLGEILNKFYTYIESKHNGYRDWAKELGWECPISHFQALKELIEEWDSIRDQYDKLLEKELERLKRIVDRQQKTIEDYLKNQSKKDE